MCIVYYSALYISVTSNMATHGDCIIDICLLHSNAFVCFVCVFPDKFHVRLLYDRICGPTK